jgi:hypothetical protein
MGIVPIIKMLEDRRLIHTTTEEVDYWLKNSINSKIISEELSISWRLKKQIGENVMYFASDLKFTGNQKLESGRVASYY